MKSIRTFVAVIALATSPGSSAAQTMTATGSTLEGAEVKIVAQAGRAGVNDHETTQAYTGNHVHMIAELLK